ncbi:MAG: FAD/NAD(P)-binding oxidoreductase [Nitrososphaerales archaeon]
MKNVVILGGGVGGTIVANITSRKLKKDANVTLIDKSGKHIYQPGFVYVAFGDEQIRNIVRDEHSLLNNNVNLITKEATKIDPKNRKVFLDDGESLDYDYLVIATGSRIVLEEVKGLKEGAYHFYEAEAAEKLRQALKSFTGGKIVVGVGGVPYKCPPAPAEAACQLDYYFEKRGIRDKVQIEFLSPLPRVFPLEAVNPFVTKIFEEKKIAYHTFFNVDYVDPEVKKVYSLEGESVDYDLLILVPPHRGAKVIEESGLGDRGGWIPTDKYTLQAKGFDDIYVVGDATDIPISKAGATAHYEAKIVAENIINQITGIGGLKHYDGKVRCFCDAGFNRGISLSFDYTHPPKPPSKLTFSAYLGKVILNKMYWWTIPSGRF